MISAFALCLLLCRLITQGLLSVCVYWRVFACSARATFFFVVVAINFSLNIMSTHVVGYHIHLEAADTLSV